MEPKARRSTYLHTKRHGKRVRNYTWRVDGSHVKGGRRVHVTEWQDAATKEDGGYPAGTAVLVLAEGHGRSFRIIDTREVHGGADAVKDVAFDLLGIPEKIS